MDIFLKLRIGLNLFELLACLSGFANWKKIRGSYWEYFPFYLAIIFLSEVIGEYAGYRLHWVKFNLSWYRFFVIPFQFLFFYWLFWKYFSGDTVKTWVLAGLLIYLLSWILESAFLAGVETTFYSFTYLAGNVVLLVLVIVFFAKFMRSDEILNYKQSMMFWVSVGLLVFYLMSLPLYGLWNTLVYNYYDFFNDYWIAITLFNYMMYLLFTIAFIWGRPK
ncbi:MAG: hypothetical protein ACXWV2_09520 [Chitinophagaceae bacterium]